VDFYRYGFNGIYCQHSLSAASALLDCNEATLNLIVLHLGGGTGICCATNMREVMKNARQGEHSAMVTVEMFCYRIKKYIGAYCAVLGDVSALIFTGGTGGSGTKYCKVSNH